MANLITNKVPSSKFNQHTCSVFKAEVHIIVNDTEGAFGVFRALIPGIHLTNKWHKIVLVECLKILRFGVSTLRNKELNTSGFKCGHTHYITGLTPFFFLKL